MLVNIQAWTPSWTVPAMMVATTYIKRRVNKTIVGRTIRWPHLAPKHGSGWDWKWYQISRSLLWRIRQTFHVVAELEVRSESQGLGHCLVIYQHMLHWQVDPIECIQYSPRSWTSSWRLGVQEGHSWKKIELSILSSRSRMLTQWSVP